MDALFALPNVVQAGGPTGTDSIFLGSVAAKLPSGQAFLIYGDAAWIDRTRGSNVPYTPQGGMLYTGDPANESALKAFVQQAASH
jgi:hypothetical protein